MSISALSMTTSFELSLRWYVEGHGWHHLLLCRS